MTPASAWDVGVYRPAIKELAELTVHLSRSPIAHEEGTQPAGHVEQAEYAAEGVKVCVN